MNIPRLLKATIAASGIWATSIPANAQTICLYTMMVQTHAMMDHCGDTLGSASEQSYQKSTQALAALMIANTPSMKGKFNAADWSKKYEKSYFDKLASKDQSMCKTPDYAGFKAYLLKMTSPAGETAINKTLTAPKYFGDNACV